MTRPDDYLMAWEDSADRVPVLWLHGFPFNATLWDEQIDGLTDVARSIAPDLRGFGLSAPTDDRGDLARYADDCARLLDHVGLTGPVVVAGLSMGGYLAYELARRHPQRVAGLVLAATRATPESAEGKAGRDAAAAEVRAHGVEAVADAMLPKLLAPDSYENRPDLVDFVAEMMLAATPEGVLGALAAMRDRPDSRPDLPGLDVPCLVIHGEDDQLIPVSEAEDTVAALPDADLVVLPGAGHLPNLEQPEAFNAAVREFLAEVFYGDEDEDEEQDDNGVD
ncbi:alpha/beta fold hydrolase [bacterium]|nr:alpha/beta fold hydrolase [bacterium]